MAKPTIKSYLEASAQFTEMSRQQAETFVRQLVKSGDVRRRDTEQMVQTMLSRGRETTDRISSIVQTEVAKQLRVLSERFDDVEHRLESLASSIRDGIVGVAGDVMGSPSAPPSSSSSMYTAAAEPVPTSQQPTGKKSASKRSGSEAGRKKSSAKKSSAKKSSAKKSSAKKSGAKKSGAKKSGAKKSSAKKTAAKRTTSGAMGTSGVRKVRTTRRAFASE